MGISIFNHSYKQNFMNEIKNKTEYQEVISQGKTLAYFTSNYCGPCNFTRPIIEKVATEVENVNFYKVILDDAPDVFAKCGVKNVPQIILYEHRIEIQRHVGIFSEEGLKNFVK